MPPNSASSERAKELVRLAGTRLWPTVIGFPVLFDGFLAFWQRVVPGRVARSRARLALRITCRACVVCGGRPCVADRSLGGAGGAADKKFSLDGQEVG